MAPIPKTCADCPVGCSVKSRAGEGAFSCRFLSSSTRPAHLRGGFSLLELLVVLSVAAILLALLFPSLSKVREMARRVGCASNMHQIAIGLETFADDHDHRLPDSYFARRHFGDKSDPQEMLMVRRGRHQRTGWDGIGKLYSQRYLTSPEVFYCPSHRGDHPFERYVDRWRSGVRGDIFSNYHYRGLVAMPGKKDDRPIDTIAIDQLKEVRAGGLALLADGLRTQSDFNHVIGTNLLQEDLSVIWYDDASRKIYSSLPPVPGEGWKIGEVWAELDDYGQNDGADESHDGGP